MSVKRFFLSKKKEFTMKKLLTSFLLSISFGSVNAIAQIPEIPDPQLPDIAIVQPHPVYGAQIIYNPITCQQIGMACGFFRIHEYGHVVHNHQLIHPAAYSAYKEAQADCWAAANASPYEVLAAVQLFHAGGSSSNWAVYGHPQQRAARVRDCAIQAGNWIGS